jgi:L-ascorbate metabolism protein UlaG (beta-lactamase superfamily)
MNQLEPKIFVPMHYRTSAHNMEIFGEIAELSAFNNEYGVAPQPVKKLEVTRGKLPEETEIVVFE